MSNNQLTIVGKNLNALLKAKATALPGNFNQSRWHQNALFFLQTVKNLEQMEPWSVAYCLLKGALLDLDFANKECYAIPYDGTLNFQTDYKGEIKLAKRFSVKAIDEIYAKLVREGDYFEEIIINGVPTINFKPKSFNNGEIIGAFAVCRYENGSLIYETMTKEEIEHIKKVYAKTDKKGQYSKSWRESTGEMYKKTVIRRLRKLIPISFENEQQIEADVSASDFQFEEPEEIPIQEPKAIDEEAPTIDSNETKKETTPEQAETESSLPEPPQAQEPPKSEPNSDKQALLANLNLLAEKYYSKLPPQEKTNYDSWVRGEKDEKSIQKWIGRFMLFEKKPNTKS